MSKFRLATTLACLGVACLVPHGQALAATALADDACRAAENLLAEGRWLEAAESYGRFAQQFPDDARAGEARFRRGEAFFRAGRWPEALRIFGAAESDPRARFRAANTLYLLGRTAEATEALRSLLQLKRLPEGLEGPARYFLARSLLARGKLSEARAALEAFGGSETHVKLALGDIRTAEIRKAMLEAAGPLKAPSAISEALTTYREVLETATEGRLVPETHFRIGELLRWSGRPEEAAEHYRRAAEAEPSGPVAPYARLGAAWAALQSGDAAGAARGAAAAELSGELTDEIAYVKGAAELAAGHYAAAAEALAPLAGRKTPTLPRDRLLHRLAWSAIFAGKAELAGRSASALLQMKPPAGRAAEADLVLAESELIRGRPAEALEGFESAAHAGGAGTATADLAVYGRAKALAALGKPGEAAAAFDEFSEKTGRPGLASAAKVLAARAYLAAGEAALAAERFKEARPAYVGTPHEAEIVWGASLAEYMRGDFEAMAALDREIVEKFPDSGRSADAAYWFAWSRLEAKDFGAAAEAFAEATRRAKGRPALVAAAMLERASALDRVGDAGGALEAALELVRGEFASHAPLEAVLWTAHALRRKGQTDRAAGILDAALERAGGEGRWRVLYARAELARGAGAVERAIALYDKVIGGSPGEELAAASRLGKARCLAARGRQAEAEVLLENTLDRTTGWGRAAAYYELGELRLERAAASEGEGRRRLGVRAAEDFMFVVLLYEPEGPGEGAELCARALLGAARAYVTLRRYASARDRLEQLITHPLYGTMPEAREARKLFQEIPLEALGTRD